MLTTADAETTYQVVGERKDPSPYNPKNRLVSIGIKDCKNFDYLCLYHSECQPTPNARKIIQDWLDATTVLVAHNAKFELAWLRETGFLYYGKIWDTMIVEYVLARGMKVPLDLNSCCLRHGLEGKDDGVYEYMKHNVSFENIPWDTVEKYGRQDVSQTELLALDQMNKLGGQEEIMKVILNASKYPTPNNLNDARVLLCPDGHGAERH